MRYIPGKVGLGDLGGGTLSAGTVPLDRFVRSHVTEWNAAPVTVGLTTTEIQTNAEIDLVAGDILVIAYGFYGQKTTQGYIIHGVSLNSGAAVIEDLAQHSTALAYTLAAVIADSKYMMPNVTTIHKVTGSGTAGLRLWGSCDVGSLAIAANRAYLKTLVIKGS